MKKISRRGFVKAAALAPLAAAPFAKAAQTPGKDRFDIVVAGGGHNSLITAAYLGKAGYRCLVLEGRPKLGGGVKTAQLTLRGFHEDVCSSAHPFLQDNPMIRNNELQLADYGLEYIDPDPIFHVPFLDGTYLTQWRDVALHREDSVDDHQHPAAVALGAIEHLLELVETVMTERAQLGPRQQAAVED